MKRIVILTGAGMSAESGISTFRDHDGLWQKYRMEDLATPEAWKRNPELVLEFYNQRRKQLFEVNPNAGHLALVKLEQKYDVQIITQNVDDLHERAGSSRVLHLHGELRKAVSTDDPNLIYDIGKKPIKLGDICEKGSQLRPYVVWFGEPVPMIHDAAKMASKSEIFIVIGTSLLVYPASGLIHYVAAEVLKFYIDPGAFDVHGVRNLKVIKKKAGTGVPELVDKLLRNG
jgi:NAD-dependent deacetylase